MQVFLDEKQPNILKIYQKITKKWQSFSERLFISIKQKKQKEDFHVSDVSESD